MDKPLADRLTPSQREALLVIVDRDRDDQVTYTSNRNGSSYVHSRSASKLVEYGLADWVRGSRNWDTVIAMDAGRALAAEIRYT